MAWNAKGNAVFPLRKGLETENWFREVQKQIANFPETMRNRKQVKR